MSWDQFCVNIRGWKENGLRSRKYCGKGGLGQGNWLRPDFIRLSATALVASARVQVVRFLHVHTQSGCSYVAFLFCQTLRCKLDLGSSSALLIIKTKVLEFFHDYDTPGLSE